MRRFWCISLLISVILIVCGCSETSVSSDADVTLTFVYGEDSIKTTLTDDEAANVIEILDGKEYSPTSSGTPACGFDENISLTVGDRTFAIACDTCNCIQDLGNHRFFYVSEEDITYIHSLFEKHGGYFPCV